VSIHEKKYLFFDKNRSNFEFTALSSDVITFPISNFLRKQILTAANDLDDYRDTYTLTVLECGAL